MVIIRLEPKRQAFMTDKILVLTTCATVEEAEAVSRHLIDARLVACVNITSGVRSLYRWQSRVEDNTEVMLVMKSRRDLFGALKSELRKVHSYEIPEIIALPVIDGNDEYLGWVDEELAPKA